MSDIRELLCSGKNHDYTAELCYYRLPDDVQQYPRKARIAIEEWFSEFYGKAPWCVQVIFEFDCDMTLVKWFGSNEEALSEFEEVATCFERPSFDDYV